MSKYTTELRHICESLAGLEESKGYNDVSEIISEARPKIFSFNYPIFDESYRAGLETKILRHFYTREIGAETYGRWKLFLEAKMNEIMPFYNQMYNSELLTWNPLYDADYHKEGTSEGTEEGSKTGTKDVTSTDSGSDTISKTKNETNTASGTDTVTKSKNESNTASGTDTTTTSMTDTSTLSGSDVKSTETSETEETETHNRDKYSEWDLYSDTPQGGIAGIQGAENDPSLADDGYLTNARHILHDGDGTEASGTMSKEGGSDTTTTYGKVDTRVKSGSEATQHGKVNTIAGTGSESVQHGKVNTIAGTAGETIAHGKVNTKDEDTTESRTKQIADEFAQHVYGRLGGRTGAELLIEYRKTFLNIDLQVIASLEPLFMQLW